jgi:hypothetical protein
LIVNYLHATRRSEATRESDGSGRAEAPKVRGAGANSATAQKKTLHCSVFFCGGSPKNNILNSCLFISQNNLSLRHK